MVHRMAAPEEFGRVVGRDSQGRPEMKERASLELGCGQGRRLRGFREAVGVGMGLGVGEASSRQAGFPEDLGPRAELEPSLGTG